MFAEGVSRLSDREHIIYKVRGFIGFPQKKLVSHQQSSSWIAFLMIWSCVYPEPVDEVIACKQVVDEEFEGVLSRGLVEEENIEGPLIHFLQKQPEEHEPGKMMRLTAQLITFETVTSRSHWCNMTSTSTGVWQTSDCDWLLNNCMPFFIF